MIFIEKSDSWKNLF